MSSECEETGYSPPPSGDSDMENVTKKPKIKHELSKEHSKTRPRLKHTPEKRPYVRKSTLNNTPVNPPSDGRIPDWLSKMLHAGDTTIIVVIPSDKK